MAACMVCRLVCAAEGMVLTMLVRDSSSRCAEGTYQALCIHIREFVADVGAHGEEGMNK